MKRNLHYPIHTIQMTDKIVYDLIQRFEVIDGIPHLLHSQINSIEGGTSLFS